MKMYENPLIKLKICWIFNKKEENKKSTENNWYEWWCDVMFASNFSISFQFLFVEKIQNDIATEQITLSPEKEKSFCCCCCYLSNINIRQQQQQQIVFVCQNSKLKMKIIFNFANRIDLGNEKKTNYYYFIFQWKMKLTEEMKWNERKIQLPFSNVQIIIHQTNKQTNIVWKKNKIYYHWENILAREW